MFKIKLKNNEVIENLEGFNETLLTFKIENRSEIGTICDLLTDKNMRRITILNSDDEVETIFENKSFDNFQFDGAYAQFRIKTLSTIEARLSEIELILDELVENIIPSLFETEENEDTEENEETE